MDDGERLGQVARNGLINGLPAPLAQLDAADDGHIRGKAAGVADFQHAAEECVGGWAPLAQVGGERGAAGEAVGHRQRRDEEGGGVPRRNRGATEGRRRKEEKQEKHAAQKEQEYVEFFKVDRDEFTTYNLGRLYHLVNSFLLRGYPSELDIHRMAELFGTTIEYLFKIAGHLGFYEDFLSPVMHYKISDVALALLREARGDFNRMIDQLRNERKERI